jgi:RNA polymerase sigma factor (sigma-70 family)
VLKYSPAREDPLPVTESDTQGSDHTAGGRGEGSLSAAAEFTQWRDGDPRGLERLVHRFSGVLWHVARAYGLDASAAEDVVQLTWITLVRNADGIREPQALPAWLTTAARREAARMARARSREVIGFDGSVPEVADPRLALLEDDVAADADARVLWRHVSRLSERCRHLVRVVAFEARPDYASLTTQLGMPIGGIGPTRRRCLDKLRLMLDADPTWSYR